jgi:hypothetical protein
MKFSIDHQVIQDAVYQHDDTVNTDQGYGVRKKFPFIHQSWNQYKRIKIKQPQPTKFRERVQVPVFNVRLLFSGSLFIKQKVWQQENSQPDDHMDPDGDPSFAVVFIEFFECHG